jgi:hypothetical protein
MGKSYDEVADEFGLTKQRIWQIVNQWKPKGGDTTSRDH